MRLHRELGRLSIEQARPLAALDSFRRAVALLEVIEDTLRLARAHLDCARALADAGDLDEADTRVGRAVHLLGPYPAADDLAVVRRLQAILAASRGDHEEPGRHGNQALLLARGLPSEQGRIWAARADARAAAGDPAADAAFRKALELLREHGTVQEEAGLLRSYGRYLRSTDRDAEALDVFERAAEVASDPRPGRAAGAR